MPNDVKFVRLRRLGAARRRTHVGPTLIQNFHEQLPRAPALGRSRCGAAGCRARPPHKVKVARSIVLQPNIRLDRQPLLGFHRPPHAADREQPLRGGPAHGRPSNRSRRSWDGSCRTRRRATCPRRRGSSALTLAFPPPGVALHGQADAVHRPARRNERGAAGQLVPDFRSSSPFQGGERRPVLRASRRVSAPHEILVVYDFDEDPTVPVIARLDAEMPAIRGLRNDLGRGVLNAMKAGIAASRARTSSSRWPTAPMSRRSSIPWSRSPTTAPTWSPRRAT